VPADVNVKIIISDREVAEDNFLGTDLE